MLGIISLLLLGFGCQNRAPEEPVEMISYLPDPVSPTDTVPKESALLHAVPYDVPIAWYFEYMDTIVAHYDSLLPYPITEHLIVRTNPWLIDTLAHTDYYVQAARDTFIYDSQAMPALQAGQQLVIPNAHQVDSLLECFAQTLIDVNIPEYTLRVWEGEEEKARFLVRVGQNRSKYLAMAGREVDLRTHTGEGFIWRIERNPIFINPSDNKRYSSTRRDDGKRTLLPRIPWLDPEIDGRRIGQLIHPTTNIATLGKAYSNGCIGLSEADAWRLYYYAPLKTKVIFRYDLERIDENGDTILFKNIYNRSKQAVYAAQSWLFDPGERPEESHICDCR